MEEYCQETNMYFVDKLEPSTPAYYDHDYEDYFEEDECTFDEESIVQRISLNRFIYSGDLLVFKAVRDERMIALESKCMLIVDIDCGDEVDTPINTLRAYAIENPGNYRVYKTQGGLRYIQTDCLYHGVNKPAIAALQALGSDDKYISMCLKTESFMARLTPKFSDAERRQNYINEMEDFQDSQIAVCKHLCTIGTASILDVLFDALHIHDYCTKAHKADCWLY